MKVSYSKDPLWADVIPLEQDDGPDPVCPIAYTASFKETMDYFRAIMHKDERSQRALSLTKHVIELNPANYTAWYYRRLCLVALGDSADWLQELKFCDDMSLAQQKNYQVWHHRQACVTRLGKDVRQRDLAHCSKMLDDDSKNYHVWSYRQWAVLFYRALEEEDEFTRVMIEKDVRNNSAWNERFWIGEQLDWFTNQTTCVREVEYALAQARRAPSNESPWLYLRGIAAKVPGAIDLERLQDLASKWVLCVPIRSLMVFLLEKKGDFKSALEICKECANQVDTVHAKYWNYKSAQLEGS